MSDESPESETRRAPLRRSPRNRYWVVAAVIVMGVGIIAYLGNTTAPATAHITPLPDITRLDQDDEPDPIEIPKNPGYLGPQSCAPCHAERYAEFTTTSHFRACRKPDDGPMPTGFEPGRNRFQSSDGELQFEMTRSGREFYQNVQKFGSSEPRTTHRVDLVYGANKADEVFFSWRDDRINEMMAVWLHPLNCWAHTSYDRNGSGSFARETTPRCLECHNTWIAHVPGTINEYKPEGAVLGVSCERCHGPGREHVEFHRLHAAAKKGHAIGHPGRLDRERRIEVCTQCHGNSTKARGPAFAYRPGEPLERHYRTAATRHPEDDHVANQIKYLRQSHCFQKTDTMTCVTCHDPHRPHEADPATNQKSCLQCHQPAACTDRPNLPAAVRDDCVRCHMPQRVWMNVHFHTSADQYVPPIRRSQHRIAVDRIARSEVLLDWHRKSKLEADRATADQLTTTLVDHWLAESETRRREFRFLAAIGAAREALRLDLNKDQREKAMVALQTSIETQSKLDRDLIDALHAARENRLLESMNTLEKVLSIKPDLAVARSKLGTLSAMTGNRANAVKHLETVATDDPDNASGLAMLGWLAYLDQRPAEAIAFYRKAHDIEPYDAKLNYHWGLALLPLQQWAEAESRLRQAITIDPRHAGAYQGLSHSLREQGRAVEAIRAARRAARLTAFEHLDILVTLADAYAAAANRIPEAAAAAERALEIHSMRQGEQSLPQETQRTLERMRDLARE
jgi:tetratricopeptide (TPR) repeat protein